MTHSAETQRRVLAETRIQPMPQASVQPVQGFMEQPIVVVLSIGLSLAGLAFASTDRVYKTMFASEGAPSIASTEGITPLKVAAPGNSALPADGAVVEVE